MVVIFIYYKFTYKDLLCMLVYRNFKEKLLHNFVKQYNEVAVSNRNTIKIRRNCQKFNPHLPRRNKNYSKILFSKSSETS